MAEDVVARVELDQGVRFLGRGTGDQTVAIDYPPPLGKDDGIRGGLELLLMALAACAGQEAVVRKGVEAAEKGYCPVWAMLSPTTPITSAVHVEREPAER